MSDVEYTAKSMMVGRETNIQTKTNQDSSFVFLPSLLTLKNIWFFKKIKYKRAYSYLMALIHEYNDTFTICYLRA